MAALARPRPIDAATSATVAPSGTSRLDPSGNSTCIVSLQNQTGPIARPCRMFIRGSDHRQGGGGVSVVRVVAVVDDVRMVGADCNTWAARITQIGRASCRERV